MSARATASEDRPERIGSFRPPATAAVRAIRAVYQRYEAHDRDVVPVPATMVAEPRDRADGWERDRGDVRFVGYAVQVERDGPSGERSVERIAQPGFE